MIDHCLLGLEDVLQKKKLARLQKIFESEFNFENPDEPINVMTYRWPEGDNCLHIAAIRGDIEAIRLLVELGIDIDALGDMSETALHYAASFKHDVIYDYLVSQGASEDIVSELGSTPRQLKQNYLDKNP